MSRALFASLTLASLLAGCGSLAPLSVRRAPQALQVRSVEPALVASKLVLAADVDGHHVVVKGTPGAVRGLGVWGSPGEHSQPANGEEAPATSTGAFELELHAHPGEKVTLWAFVDRGERRVYSSPVVLAVPTLYSSPPTALASSTTTPTLPPPAFSSR